jgi:hypothetical protein
MTARETDGAARRQLVPGWVLFLSLALPGAGCVVYGLLHWSKPVEGLKCAIFLMCPMLLLVWFFTQLPWTYAVFGLYRWRKWQRFRTAWALAPPIFVTVAMAGYHVAFPMTSTSMFRQLIVNPIPASVSNLRAFRSGGGLVPHNCLFYFEISPDDFPAIVGSKSYKLTDLKLNDLDLFSTSSFGESVRPGIESMVGNDSDWPMPYGWAGVEVYQYTGEGETQYTIVTDGNHRHIYVYADDYF